MKEQKNYKKDRIILISLLTGVSILLLFWSYILPEAQAPDEPMRYRIVTAINLFHKLPRGDDPYLIDPAWGNSYGFTPITSYIFGAGFRKIAMLFTDNERILLLSARLVSVLFGVATIYILYEIGRRIYSDNKKWLFVAFAGFLPQFLFMNTYVNTDAMALFGCAMLFFMWIYGHEVNWNNKAVAGTGIAVSICTLSYYNTYVFILITMFYFVVSVYLCENGKHGWWKVLLKKGLLITAIVCLLCAWWFIRNYFLYDGDILGMNACNLCGEKYAIDELKPSNLITFQKQGKPFWKLLFGGWMATSLKSFIGNFGMMDMPLANWVLVVFVVILFVGFFGCILHLKELFSFRKDGKPTIAGYFHVCALLVIIGTILLSAIYSYTGDYQPQGRYLLPMEVCMMYFEIKGYECIIKKLSLSKEKENRIYIGLSCIYVGLTLYSFVTVVCKAYI